MDSPPRIELQCVDGTDAVGLSELVILFREYAQQLGVDLSFQGFEEELATLPGDYAGPQGALLLAWIDGAPAGCGAVRPLPDADPVNACEMKRLFVRSTANGRGLGRKLCEALMQTAVRDGFRTMRLDTTRDMVEAVSLYRSFGFRDVAPFADYPERMRPMMLFMARDLAAA